MLRVGRRRGRENGHQVDDTEEAQHVASPVFGAVDAGGVFESEEYGEKVFRHFQYGLSRRWQEGAALDEGDEQADGDGGDDDDVESSPHGMVGVEEGVTEIFAVEG